MSAGQWIFLLFAVIAAAVAIGLWIWRSRMGAEMGLMASTETSRAADVAVKPAGAVVEVKGKLHTEAPLTSEFAKLPAVYYRAMTEAEVERTHYNGGKRETKREYETVSDVVKFAPAFVQDESGRVPLDLDGAKVEGKQVHRKRETEGLSLASAVGSLIGASGRVTAHRFTEWVIEPDAPIYVLGTALAGGRIGKSTGTKQAFVVSIKSEEERTGSLRRSRMWSLLGAIVAAIVAVVLLAGAIGAFGSGS